MRFAVKNADTCIYEIYTNFFEASRREDKFIIDEWRGKNYISSERCMQSMFVA